MADKKAPFISTFAATDKLYTVLRVHGYLMPKRFKFLFVIYSIFINGYSTFYTPFAFTMAILYNKNITADLSAFFTTLQLTFDIYGGTLKIIYIAVVLKKLLGTRVLIEKLDERCTEADEIALQKYLVGHGRKITIYTFSLYFAYTLTTCLGSLVIGRPPYSVYFPSIDWHNSRWELYLSSALEFLMIDLACVQQTICDGYATVFINILIYHMRILILRIQKLCKNPKLSQNENVQELIMCIKDHKNLVELHSQIHSIVSVTVFIQFSLTAVMLGVTMINVMQYSTSFSLRLGSVFFLAAIIIQSFPVCYYAQTLQNESAKLDEVIFHSQWVDQNPEYRKILIIFMHRSQSLMEFSAAKLFPITLNSFISIAKFSFSLYTLIKNIDF